MKDPVCTGDTEVCDLRAEGEGAVRSAVHVDRFILPETGTKVQDRIGLTVQTVIRV